MKTEQRVKTGVPGLDEIVGGGLPSEALYLVQGQPGTGKTTLGLQFLMEGARRGERCLYVCLAETVGQLTGIAQAYGWSLEGITVSELRKRGDGGPGERAGYTVFSPAEVELEEIAREFVETFDEVRPQRLVLDSLSEIRLVAEEPARYRRELLSLSDHVAGRGCTAMVIDIDSKGDDATVAETIVSGVLLLERLSPAYGGEHRRLQIRKLRASKSVGGFHDFAIGERGLEVYPRLVAAPHRSAHSNVALESGLGELDALLGGGLDAGTSTVLMGAAGTGKSTAAAHFVTAAAAKGAPAAMFCFDESPTNLLKRTTSLGVPLREHVDSGRVYLLPVDPAEFTPGELTHRVRTRVEAGARVVVIDSINGYLNSLPEERFLLAHLHELLAYLAEKGVVTILTLAQHGFFGANPDSPVNLSYIADTILLFRYFEMAGEVKQALSVIKKRTGRHERTIRELRFTPSGLQLGPPLHGSTGVLTSSPQLQAEAKGRGAG